MDTCQFSYIRASDDTFRTVIGVEQAWDVLREKCDRTGPGIPGASYYLTITIDGPDLFAVLDKNNKLSVYHHEDGQWHRYVSALDIKFGTINDEGTTDPLIRATENDQLQKHILNQNIN